MASADQIRHAFERYCAHLTAHDADAIADLYADDAVVEDPAGSPPIVGRPAIREFYAGALERARPDAVLLTGPVRVLASGLAGAATLESHSSRDGHPVRIDIIDVMTFDATGAITSMQAYWGPDNIHPAP
jgi:steroid Delta-isomerase